MNFLSDYPFNFFCGYCFWKKRRWCQENALDFISETFVNDKGWILFRTEEDAMMFTLYFGNLNERLPNRNIE
jgi:hypothetical protein